MIKKQKVFLFVLVIIIIAGIPAYASGYDTKDAVNYLESVIKMLEEKHNDGIDIENVVDSLVTEVFNTADPYTVYFDNDEYSMFISNVNNEYEGIGISMVIEGDYITVLKVFDNSPAQHAGLLGKDKIVSVDGVSIVGASTEEAAALIKGDAGTTVVLGILREGYENVIIKELTREKIIISSVNYSIDNNVGYIKIESFSLNVSSDVQKALDYFDENNITKVIIDVRDNPGGYVDQAVELARYFVPEGLITKLDFKSEKLKDIEYMSYLKQIKYDLAVLVNENTASAAELFAGAVRDRRCGKVIGMTTFGKGVVQQTFPVLTVEACLGYYEKTGEFISDAYDLIMRYGYVPYDNEIAGWAKITTGEYYTPADRKIQDKGLPPNTYITNPNQVNGIYFSSLSLLSENGAYELGDNSTDILYSERFLKAAGYEIGEADNDFDEVSQNAVMDFQNDNNLDITGILDEQTQKTMNIKLLEFISENDRQYKYAVNILNQQ